MGCPMAEITLAHVLHKMEHVPYYAQHKGAIQPANATKPRASRWA